MRVLRGHHLLCVHGFVGMGYSPSFVEKMSEIVEDIRSSKEDFPIRVVKAFDDACLACPHKGDSKCKENDESDAFVKSLDQKVMSHLGIQHGEVVMKNELMQLTAARVKPNDLDRLCAGCSWLEYGVCKKGIAELNKKVS